MLFHGENVGSIRTHHSLPVQTISLLALEKGLFSTLLWHQRILNLMAAVEGIGFHQLIKLKKKKKKKKKKNFLANTPGFLVWIADYTLGYFFTHSKASSPANGF